MAALTERRVRVDPATGTAIATMATRVTTATRRHPNSAPNRGIPPCGRARGRQRSGPCSQNGYTATLTRSSHIAFLSHIDMNASPQQARWRREEHAFLALPEPLRMAAVSTLLIGCGEPTPTAAVEAWMRKSDGYLLRWSRRARERTFDGQVQHGASRSSRRRRGR